MKQGFIIMNCLLTISLAYACVDLFYKTAVPERDIVLVRENIQGSEQGDDTAAPSLVIPMRNESENVTARNLFQVELEAAPEKSDDSENVKTEDLEATHLKLVLWGTVTGQDDAWAVIEDKKARQQSLYLVGDTVQGAEIKKILRQKVILNYQGKDQILEMENDEAKKKADPPVLPRLQARTPVMPPASQFQQRPEIVMPDRSMVRENQGSGPDEALRQVKFRPHFSEGEPDGLMVYGIRPNSIFREVGLRNGDIIKQINGEAVNSQEEGLRVLEQIMDAEPSKLTLFRRGKIKELMYPADQDQDSEQ